jgi:hypothetical protein
VGSKLRNETPSGDSAPAITSANQTIFAVDLPGGNCTTVPYNCFTVTTTGYPVPRLTAKDTSGIAFPYFTDNGNGTATIAYAPSEAGTINLTITATGVDGAAVTQAFTLQVVRLVVAPVFTSADQAIFTAGQPNTFTIAAGPFVDVFTACSEVIGASSCKRGSPPASLPAGVTLTDNHNGTATLSGSPTSPGVSTFEITASNPAATKLYTGTQTFTLYVVP